MGNIENKMVVRGDTKDAVNAFNRLQKTLYVNGRTFENYGNQISGFFSPALKATAAVQLAMMAANTVLRSEAYKTAESLDEAMAKVAQGTGATGRTLAEYQNYVRELFRDNPAENYGEIGAALAQVQSSTGATGERLKTLTQQFYSLAQVSGAELNPAIRLGARLFADWNVATDKQTKVLDALYVASRDTGSSVESVAESAVQFGAKFRILGYSVEETIGLLAKWNREGVSTEKALAGLGMAVTNLAKKGGDLPSQWRALQSSIRGAKSEVEAVNTAVKYFGSKAAPDMAAAIREGRFELGDMVKTLQNSGGAVQSADDSTKTLTERLRELRNTAADKLLEPLGQDVAKYVDHVRELLGVLIDWASKNDVLRGSVEALLKGVGLTDTSVEGFRRSLAKIDVAAVKQDCEQFGETLGKLYKGFVEIASNIPWKELADNADTVVKVIVYGWAAGKTLGIAGTILETAKSVNTLYDAMKKLSKVKTLFDAATWTALLGKLNSAKGVAASLVPTLGMLGAASAGAVADILLFPDAAEGVDESMGDIQKAIAGDAEAFDRLDPKVQSWLEKTGQYKPAAEKAKHAVESLGDEMARLRELAAKASTPLYLVPENLAGGGDKEISAVASAIEDLEQKMAEAKTRGETSVKGLGISAQDAALVVREAVEKSAKDIYDTLNKTDPFAAAAFVAKMKAVGAQSGDALMTSLAEAMNKKKDLPLESLTGALKSGFVTGKGVSEIMKLIIQQVQKVQSTVAAQVTQDYAGYGLSASTMKGLSQYRLQQSLSGAGLSMAAPKAAAGLSASRMSVGSQDNRKQTMNVTINVNGATTSNAKKIGTDLSSGLAKSFGDMGIGY